MAEKKKVIGLSAETAGELLDLLGKTDNRPGSVPGQRGSLRHQWVRADANSTHIGSYTAAKLIRWTGGTVTTYEECWAFSPDHKLQINKHYQGEWAGIHTDGKPIIAVTGGVTGDPVTKQLLTDVTVTASADCNTNPPTITMTVTKTFTTGTFPPGTTFTP